MEIRIFDVAHGFCAYVVADNGNVMLIDCGHNNDTGFHPADFLRASGCTGIESFFSLNYDEDHLSGLPRLRTLRNCIPISLLYRNDSITAHQLRDLKVQSGPLGSGVSALLEMIETFTTSPTSLPEYQSLDFKVFYNRYPEFTDTNNLSLVLFLHYPGLSIIFPGDLEQPGWGRLLQQSDFRANLARVNIFVASHHGRLSGYVQNVFKICKPDIIIISDETIRYETQEAAYGSHANGIQRDGETRKVLTTRQDGMITISAEVGGGCCISAVKW